MSSAEPTSIVVDLFCQAAGDFIRSEDDLRKLLLRIQCAIESELHAGRPTKQLFILKQRISSEASRRLQT